MTSPLPAAAAERLEAIEALDAPAKKIGKTVRNALPGGPVKDALSGTWMGHALHPLLTDIPIGTFTSAFLCDVAGEETAARKLIAAGLAATPATIVTGWSDWADSEVGDAGVRRSGLVHAAFNATATVLMTASWVARRRGDGGGKLLSLAGLGLIGAGGWIGGHLSYGRGIGVDQTAFDTGPSQWTALDVRESELTEGRAVCALAGETPVMLVRHQGEIRALHNRCAHRGGPLHEGEISDGTVTCPWHKTVFALADGSVERGPSAYPQPAFDVRATDGRIEVRHRAH